MTSFFLVKIVKPLGTLFIIKLYARVSIFTRTICVLKYRYLKRQLFLKEARCNIYMQRCLRTVKNLCPNLETHPLPSKVPGCASELILFLGTEHKKKLEKCYKEIGKEGVNFISGNQP